MKLSFRIISTLLAIIILLLPITVFAENSIDKSFTILFTSDVHDYIYSKTINDNGTSIEIGGASRLKTLLDKHKTDNSIYVDCGDFSMGTLMQAGFSDYAFELRNLGILGCDVATFGNHEFDYGLSGLNKMLNSAMDSGDTLPQLVLSNLDLSGELTDEQKEFKKTIDNYGLKEYTILEKNGYKIGVFGLEGIDSIDCVQSDVNFTNYIDSAKSVVEKIKNEGADIIIALSHSGNDGAGGGEDIELAKSVSGIDVIISGHTHTSLSAPIVVNDTIIASCGSNLTNLGKIVVNKENNEISLKSFDLLKVDNSVEKDLETENRINEYKNIINENYLKDYDCCFDDIISYSNYDMISLEEMYATHVEYSVGDLIADSYIYEAEKNGIDDIDVALVGLGTVRGSFFEGKISVADAFEICSLGVGGDGSAGHPLLIAYVYGSELKLMTELDASLGNFVSSIKMSYSGLTFSFNNSRVLLDRVTDVSLVSPSGEKTAIEDDKLYKCVVNMYAANMLGMLNSLTNGALSISCRDENGEIVSDYYSVTIKATNGKEIKEWVALKNYLSSFDVGSSGYPEIPQKYSESQGRKNPYNEGGLAVLAPGGVATGIIPTLLASVFVILLLVAFLVFFAIIRKKRLKKEVITSNEDNKEEHIVTKEEDNVKH